MYQPTRFVSALAACAASLLLAGLPQPAQAGEFSVTPIRIELKGGAMNETVTVVNHAKEKLRLSVKLVEWTQDASGQDVYKDSSDLIYFPRQLEVEPEGRRLVRVGARAPAGVAERAYRLFIEEEPEAVSGAARSQVAFLFRFGVPVFLPPAVARPQPEVLEPTLQNGKLAVVVRNPGNQHFRLVKLTVSDGANHTQELPGWYSLAGTERTYVSDLPADVCRRARTIHLALEGEGFRFDRKIDVDPTRCA
jgi:fimbrial chaperone protein